MPDLSRHGPGVSGETDSKRFLGKGGDNHFDYDAANKGIFIPKQRIMLNISITILSNQGAMSGT